MADPTGEADKSALRLDFDRRVMLEFRGSAITSDAGLLPYRELDDALALTTTGGEILADTRTGKNGRHQSGRVQEKESLLIRGLKVPYGPALAAGIRAPLPVIAVAVLLFAGAVVLFATLGQEFTPTLDEKNIVMEVKRIPSTSLSQSQSMQLA